MSRPVPLFPSLPRSPNAPVLDQMVQFDADLTRSLFLYLSDLARRANDALTVDGADPMEGNLDMGGFGILNAASIEIEGTTLPQLTIRDSDSTGNAVAGGMRIEGSDAVRKGFFGDASGSDSDMYIISDAGNIRLNPATGSDKVILTRGQLQFPVTDIPSTDANTLDDYQEGSWSPTVAGTTTPGVATYTGVRDGHYTKIGRVVYFRINVGWTAHTGTGNMRISDLPFTVGSYGVPSGFPMVTIPVSGLTYAGELQAIALGGTTNLDIFLSASGATIAAFPLDTSAQIEIGGFYFV